MDRIKAQTPIVEAAVTTLLHVKQTCVEFKDTHILDKIFEAWSGLPSSGKKSRTKVMNALAIELHRTRYRHNNQMRKTTLGVPGKPRRVFTLCLK